MIIRLLKIRPIRAANILGPALIMFSFRPKYVTIPLDETASRLYLEKSKDLKKKSMARKITGIMLCERTETTISNTVNIPLIRATLSFTF